MTDKPQVIVKGRATSVVKVTEDRIMVTAGEERVRVVTAAEQGPAGGQGGKGEPGKPGEPGAPGELKPDEVINGGYF